VQHLREPAERRLRLAERAGPSVPAPPVAEPEPDPGPAPPAAEPEDDAPARAREAGGEQGANLRVVASGPAAQWVAPERSSGRRTVVIRGQAIPAISARPLIEVERRRPPRRAAERMPGRPDRIASWAVFLGLLLIAVALLTAHP